LRSAARLGIVRGNAIRLLKTGARSDFGHAIALPIPHTHKQDFRAGGIFEYVKDGFCAIQLKKARAPRIRTRRRAGSEQQAEFRELLRCMVPKVFEKRRLLCEICGHDLFSPHRA